jgi:oxaloacetate decarboxylase beta subunit
MAARVSHNVGLEANKRNYLVMHAMGPNLAGVLGTATAGGILITLLLGGL